MASCAMCACTPGPFPLETFKVSMPAQPAISANAQRLNPPRPIPHRPIEEVQDGEVALRREADDEGDPEEDGAGVLPGQGSKQRVPTRVEILGALRLKIYKETRVDIF